MITILRVNGQKSSQLRVHINLEPLTRFSIVLCLLLFFGLASAANPQSTDNTLQAKAHYQNAMAAIEKNDWQTAKNELIQAEKLAPNNALVHCHLAFAYSHTGQNTLAKTELNKALQLGLPEEQKKLAEELRKQLASQSAPTKQAQATGSKTGATSMLIKADADCRIQLDDQDLGSFKSGSVRVIKVALGEHLVHAVADEGGEVWDKTITLDKPQQVVVLTDLAGVIDAKRQAEAAKEAVYNSLDQFSGVWNYTEPERSPSAGGRYQSGGHIHDHGLVTVHWTAQWTLRLMRNGEELQGTLLRVDVIRIANDSRDLAFDWNGDEVTSATFSRNYKVYSRRFQNGAINLYAKFDSCSGDCSHQDYEKIQNLSDMTDIEGFVQMQSSRQFAWLIYGSSMGPRFTK